MAPVSNRNNIAIIHPNPKMALLGLESRNRTRSSCRSVHSATADMPNRSTILHDRFDAIVSRTLLIMVCPLISLFQNWWLLAPNVWRVYAVLFAAYQQINFSSRQTAWSELNNSLSTNVSVVNTLVMRRQSSISIAFCGTGLCSIACFIRPGQPR